MSDSSYKNIEDVKVGEIVKAFNEETGQIENHKVLDIQTPVHEEYYNLYFGE